MATMKHNGVLKYVDANKNINILYPEIGEVKSQADYDLLSEEEKLSGTYWIPDGTGGGGGGTSIDLDPTLSVEGKAADAKAVGDAISVQFNSSTGCLKVLQDGRWIDTNTRVYSDRTYLIEEGINNNKVSIYAGGYIGLTPYTEAASLTAVDDGSLRFTVKDAATDVSLMSKEMYDLTPCSKIVLRYKTTYSGTLDGYFGSRLFVTDTKQATMVAVCVIGINNSTTPTKEGIIELDISAVEGQFFIGISNSINVDTNNIFIYDWYFE